MTKYNLYDRIYDDNGNDIGIVIGFQKGNNLLPEEYTPLEYIELDHAYIDTGIVLDTAQTINTMKLHYTVANVAWEDANHSNHLLGAVIPINGVNKVISLYTGAEYISGVQTETYFGIKIGTVAWRLDASSYPKLLNRYRYDIDNLQETITDVETNTILGTNTATAVDFGLINDIRINGVKGIPDQYAESFNTVRVYDFEIEGIAHMIPAKRSSDGVVGMYDTIRNQFYTQTNTTGYNNPAVAGPETIDYAIVCLNAKYRTFGDILSGNDNVTVGKCWGYNSVMNMTDSGTYETQKILDFIVSNPSYTSSGAMYARNQIFSIDNITYRAQLPNFPEALKISKNIKRINEEDPSASVYSNKLIPVITSTSTTAEQMYASFGSTTWYQQNSNGEVTSASNVFQIKPLGMSDASNRSQTAGKLIVPILELPLEEVTPTPTQKYKLFDRVKDVNNNEIGTVSGFYTKDGIEYAVVCLDAKDRALDKAIFSDNTVQIQGITSLNANSTITPYELTETATDNTDALLVTATATSKTSEAATFVRTKLYSVGGNVYYGQIPTIKELTEILMNYSTINLLDTTSGSYSNYIIKDLYQSKRSSSQYFNNGSGYTFNWNWDGIMSPIIPNATTRYDSHDTLLIPVLEIPNI